MIWYPRHDLYADSNCLFIVDLTNYLQRLDINCLINNIFLTSIRLVYCIEPTQQSCSLMLTWSHWYRQVKYKWIENINFDLWLYEDGCNIWINKDNKPPVSFTTVTAGLKGSHLQAVNIYTLIISLDFLYVINYPFYFIYTVTYLCVSLCAFYITKKKVTTGATLISIATRPSLHHKILPRSEHLIFITLI